MKLDKRIKEGKKYLDCFDTEIAKQFIGKKGYFANNISAYEDLEKFLGGFHLWISTLRKIEDDEVIAFGDDFGHLNCYFLPEEWVKKPEKKYRLHYRSKYGTEFRHMYLGTLHKLESVKITLGDSSYSLERLFEEYEIEVDGEWLPFGVEVEEE